MLESLGIKAIHDDLKRNPLNFRWFWSGSWRLRSKFTTKPKEDFQTCTMSNSSRNLQNATWLSLKLQNILWLDPRSEPLTTVKTRLQSRISVKNIGKMYFRLLIALSCPKGATWQLWSLILIEGSSIVGGPHVKLTWWKVEFRLRWWLDYEKWPLYCFNRVRCPIVGKSKFVLPAPIEMIPSCR